MIFVFLSLFTFPLVSSSNIGISPASENFTNVLRGGYSEKTVVISTDSEDEILVMLEPFGEIKDWIKIENETVKLSKGNPYQLKLVISPPSDIPNRVYSGFLRFSVKSNAEAEEGFAVGKVNPSLDLRIDVGVTDVELVSCSVTDVVAYSAEEGEDVVIRAKVHNGGNVRINPNIVLDIWDQDQISLLATKNFLGEEILPSSSGDVEMRFSSSPFEIGQYWGELSFLECYFSQTVTFDVLKEGSLSSKGSLLSILSKKRIKVGEINPITATFENTGEKEVNAQFKGEVLYHGKIVGILESEISRVPVNSKESFSFYFTPQKEGTYVIKGRVFYNNKKTFELSSSFEAYGKSFSLWYLFYSVFLLLILFLLYKIYKIKNEKRRHLHELRRIKE